MFRTALRRLTKAAIVGGLGVLVAVWFRRREPDATDPDSGPAQWPPLSEDAVAVPPAAASPDDDHAGALVVEPSDGSAAPAPAGAWVAPETDGSCPISHPVKVKLRSGIYHLPHGAAYERTNADRCYPDPGAAEADGYRQSKT